MQYEPTRLDNLIKAAEVKRDRVERQAYTIINALKRIKKGIKEQKRIYHKDKDLQEKIQVFNSLKSQVSDLRNVYVERNSYNNRLDNMLAFHAENSQIKLPSVHNKLKIINPVKARASTAIVKGSYRKSAIINKELDFIYNNVAQTKPVSAMKKLGSLHGDPKLGVKANHFSVKFDGQTPKRTLRSKNGRNRPHSNITGGSINHTESNSIIDNDEKNQQNVPNT